ncbi:hypothetical protein SNEBB_005718, partial [Seison nebaliae]
EEMNSNLIIEERNDDYFNDDNVPVINGRSSTNFDNGIQSIPPLLPNNHIHGLRDEDTSELHTSEQQHYLAGRAGQHYKDIELQDDPALFSKPEEKSRSNSDTLPHQENEEDDDSSADNCSTYSNLSETGSSQYGPIDSRVAESQQVGTIEQFNIQEVTELRSELIESREENSQLNERIKLLEAELRNRTEVPPLRKDSSLDENDCNGVIESRMIEEAINSVMDDLVENLTQIHLEDDESQKLKESFEELEKKVEELEETNSYLSNEVSNHLITIESLSNRLTSFEEVYEMFPDIHNSLQNVLDSGVVENENERRLLQIAVSRLDYVDAKISNNIEVINQDIVPRLIDELTIAIRLNSTIENSVDATGIPSQQQAGLLRELAKRETEIRCLRTTNENLTEKLKIRESEFPSMSPTGGQSAEIVKLMEQNTNYLQMINSQEMELKILEERLDQCCHQVYLKEEEVDILNEVLSKTRQRNEELELIINDNEDFIPTINSTLIEENEEEVISKLEEEQQQQPNSLEENDAEIFRQLYYDQSKRLQQLAAKLTYTNPRGYATAKQFAEKIKEELETWSRIIREGQGLTRILDGTEDVQSILQSINENISSLRNYLAQLSGEWICKEDTCAHILENIDSTLTETKNKKQNHTVILHLEETNEKLTEELKSLKENNEVQDYANKIILENINDMDYNAVFD